MSLLQVRTYEEKFEDTKGVIKKVNLRWTDNRVAKRYQKGNQNGKLKMDRQ
jgi:hypothetical protein